MINVTMWRPASGRFGHTEAMVGNLTGDIRRTLTTEWDKENDDHEPTLQVNLSTFDKRSGEFKRNGTTAMLRFDMSSAKAMRDALDAFLMAAEAEVPA